MEIDSGSSIDGISKLNFKSGVSHGIFNGDVGRIKNEEVLVGRDERREEGEHDKEKSSWIHVGGLSEGKQYLSPHSLYNEVGEWGSRER